MLKHSIKRALRIFPFKEPRIDTLNQGFSVNNASLVNHVETEPLPRDQTQSLRLREPIQMLSSIDPITNRDIVDGNMTMHVESTRQAYMDTPVDHPLHLADNPPGDGCADD